MIKYLFITATVLFFCSCSDENRIYSDHQDLSPDVEWLKKDVRTFQFEIVDISVPYDLSLTFRYAEGYPYDKSKVLVTHINPSGKELSKSYTLTVRNQDGTYVGEPGYDIWDSEHMIEEGILFNEAGKYTLKIEHDMPADPLILVMEIGVNVYKTEIE